MCSSSASSAQPNDMSLGRMISDDDLMGVNLLIRVMIIHGIPPVPMLSSDEHSTTPHLVAKALWPLLDPFYQMTWIALAKGASVHGLHGKEVSLMGVLQDSVVGSYSHDILGDWIVQSPSFFTDKTEGKPQYFITSKTEVLPPSTSGIVRSRHFDAELTIAHERCVRARIF